MSPISLESVNATINISSRKKYRQLSPETFTVAVDQDLSSCGILFLEQALNKSLQTKSLNKCLINDRQKQKLSYNCRSHVGSLIKPVLNKSLQGNPSSKQFVRNFQKLTNTKEAKLSFKSSKKMAGKKRKQPEDEIPATNEYVTMDCEFVGVGPKAASALGRCSVVDYDGRVICDIYAKPDEPVTDYRTRWSGIRPRNLINAVPFENARNIVRAALKDRIVVGHAVHNDFKVLNINHPFDRIRDTSNYKPLRRMAGLPTKSLPSLKKLTKNLLGQDIQTGEHSSVEDSRATMNVFKIVRADWEKEILEEKERRDAQRNKKPRREYDDDDVCSSSSSNSDDDVSYLSDAFWPDELER